MKTTLYVNRRLLEEAMALSNIGKVTEVVNLALEEFVRRRRVERLAGRLGRENLALTPEDLEEMRRDE
ncbi:MAG: type II toxin-antitoxin system VapB family antitoxin [Firmicutes bacterium]|nr:type II toxin-antitoxin system VapB family antitoxin [Bacillota bacterium]